MAQKLWNSTDASSVNAASASAAQRACQPITSSTPPTSSTTPAPSASSVGAGRPTLAM